MTCNRCSAPCRGRLCRHCEIAQSHEDDPRHDDGRDNDEDDAGEEP